MRDSSVSLEVSMREFLEQRIDALRTEIVTRLDASDKAVIIQLDAKEKALMLKSVEVERRLEMLNGEAGRLAKVLAESVPREVWEQSQKALQDWKDGVDKSLNTAAGASQRSVYIVGLLFTALALALKFFIK